MSRERFIDPKMWCSDQIMDVEPLTRLLFVGLITTADDCGFVCGAGGSLKASIFPGDAEIGRDDVLAMRDKLAEAELLRIYELRGKEYVWLPSFMSHQPIKWRSKGKILPKLADAGLFKMVLTERGQVAEYGPVETGTQVEPEPACQNLPEPARLSQNPPESGEGRGGEGSSGAPQGAPTQTLSGLSDQHGDVGLELVGGFLLKWGDVNGFKAQRRLDEAIKGLAERDPETLVAHVLEADSCPEAKDRRAILLNRLKPKAGPPIWPSGDAMRQAKQLLWPDEGRRTGKAGRLDSG